MSRFNSSSNKELNDKINNLKNDIGDLTTLPDWLKTNIKVALQQLNDYIQQIGLNPKQPPYNAYGDGNSHPLNTRFSTLVEAQKIFPLATSLTDEIDWCAIQEVMRTAKGYVYIPKGSGSYVINKGLVFRNNLRVAGSGGKNSTAIVTVQDWDITNNPFVIKMTGDHNVLQDINISCNRITDDNKKPDVIILDNDPATSNSLPWEATIYNVRTNGGKNGFWIKNGLETHVTRSHFYGASESGVLVHEPDVYMNDVSTDQCKYGIRTLGGSVTAHHFHAINSKKNGFYLEGADFCQFTDCHADTSGETGILILNTSRIMMTSCWSFDSSALNVGIYRDWSLTNVTNSTFTNCSSKGSVNTKASFYIGQDTMRNHFVNCHAQTSPDGYGGTDNGVDAILNKNKFVACTGALARFNAKDNTSKHSFTLTAGASTTFSSYLFFSPDITSNAIVFEIRITTRETSTPQNIYFGKVYKAIVNGATATDMPMTDLLGSNSTSGKNFTISVALHADGDKLSVTITNNSGQSINYGIEVERMQSPRFTI